VSLITAKYAEIAELFGGVLRKSIPTLVGSIDVFTLCNLGVAIIVVSVFGVHKRLHCHSECSEESLVFDCNNTLNTCVILSEAKHALSMSKGIPYMFNLFEPLQVQSDSAFQGFFLCSSRFASFAPQRQGKVFDIILTITVLRDRIEFFGIYYAH